MSQDNGAEQDRRPMVDCLGCSTIMAVDQDGYCDQCRSIVDAWREVKNVGPMPRPKINRIIS